VGLKIRDARLEDGRALARLVGQLGYPTSPEALARRVRRLTVSATDRLVVAELEGQIVGLASVHVSLALEYDEPAAKLSAIVR
jgi:N-acetylglutamate synthase-like GNAT family acetyltransferase